MNDKVLLSIRTHDLLKKNDSVIVAVSGGADSMALLHCLNSNKFLLEINLKAVHINHGIRGKEAKRDEDFLVKYCSDANIPLTVFHVDVPKEALNAGEGLEECGRRIRYEILDSIDEISRIATGHTLNDSAETFIINLVRGTGLKGLCGIPRKRGKIIRPLLDCSRDEIENYCRDNKIDFVTDSTNFDSTYLRNKIRLEIMPALKEINTSFYSAFDRCISSLVIDEDYLSSASVDLVNKSKIGEKYSIPLLLESHPSIYRRAIASIIATKIDASIASHHIIGVEKILKSGGKITLPNNTHIASDKNLLFFPKTHNKVKEWCYSVNVLPFVIDSIPFSDEIIIINKIDLYLLQKINKELYANLIDCDTIGTNVVIRNRQQNDKLKIPDRNCTKSLKKLYSEYHMPIEKRSSNAVLADEKGVIWVQGFGVDARCQITNKTQNIWHIQTRSKYNAE